MNKEQLDGLLIPEPPWVRRICIDDSFSDVVSAWFSANPRVRVIMIDAKECPSVPAFYRALAQSAAFPGYFGENAPAMIECLTDGDVVVGGVILICITQAESFLSEATVEDRGVVYRAFNQVGQLLSRPAEGWVPSHWVWRTSPVPFHVLLLLKTSEGNCHGPQGV